VIAASQYWELSVGVTEEVSEGLTNFAWEQGALGVLEEADADGRARLRAFFPASTTPDLLRGRLRDYLAGLRALGFSAIDDARLAPIADPGWAEAWRDHFRPLAIGDRLLIIPPWAEVPDAGRVTLVIEPGRAFGTGYHGSTAGCLELLERCVARAYPPRAIDLGTGSGILAIAAARLGVARVMAVDDDPDAVANARVNIEHNRVGDRVTCALGDADALAAEPAPLVLANLLSAAHRRLAATYRRLLIPGGTLVLGGILEPEATGVLDTLREHGFGVGSDLTRQEWTALAVIRDGR
jgi:ribosomal protein L11 methyltransferase